jgi:hypothetical protein
MSRSISTLLVSLLTRRLPPAASAWLEAAAAEAAGASAGAGLLERLGEASRRVGKTTVSLAPEERADLGSPDLAALVDARGADEVARIALLALAAERLGAGELEALVEAWWAQGDSREKQALLRALPFLPEPERFLATAVEACRSHVQPLFEAVACENPFPATHFPEPNFNQMVLKALFIGVSTGRIQGLTGRVTPELRRMARDYQQERVAAGRTVSEDIRRLAAAEGSHA